MDNTISNISNHLINEFNAIEITTNEFISLSSYDLNYINNDTVKIYKIEDENIIIF